MSNLTILLLLLPAVALCCHKWPISRLKSVYMCPDSYLVEVETETGKTIYVTREPEFKQLVCFANRLKTRLQVTTLPEFSVTEVRELCDYFKAPKVEQ